MKRRQLFLILLLIFLLALGCNAKKETAGEAVTNILEAIKELDLETLEKYLVIGAEDRDEYSQEDYRLFMLLMGNVEYEVLEFKESENSALVKTEISNINLTDVLASSMQEIMALVMAQAFTGNEMEIDEQAIEKILLEALQKNDYETYTTIVDVKLQRLENNWLLDLEDNEEFQDALSGGFFSSMAELEHLFKF